MKKLWLFAGVSVCLGLLAHGSMAQSYGGGIENGDVGTYDASPVAPAAAAVPHGAPSAAGYDVASLVSELSALRDRLERVERALVRLDKRMQLVERNALGRMSSGGEPAPLSAPSATVEAPAAKDRMYRPMSYDNAAPEAASYADEQEMPSEREEGYQSVSLPVSSGGISDSLQAAPAAASARAVPMDSASVASGLPSLADRAAPEGSAIHTWAVSYEGDKVWPAKDELLASREVVEALRSGKSFVVYARGADPSSAEFRERVRALSKYLGKVADLESVPISAMAAKHLERDVIEVMVAQ